MNQEALAGLFPGEGKDHMSVLLTSGESKHGIPQPYPCKGNF